MTHDEVIARIEAFNTEWADMQPDYSFAHIVLGDYNLGNGHIDYCLDKSAQSWFDGQVQDCIELGENPKSAYTWERYRYTRLLNFMDAAIGFLNELKEIPEDVRDTVMSNKYD